MLTFAGTLTDSLFRSPLTLRRGLGSRVFCAPGETLGFDETLVSWAERRQTSVSPYQGLVAKALHDAGVRAWVPSALHTLPGGIVWRQNALGEYDRLRLAFEFHAIKAPGGWTIAVVDTMKGIVHDACFTSKGHPEHVAGYAVDALSRLVRDEDRPAPLPTVEDVVAELHREIGARNAS